jgi:hypothetical protein
MSANRRALAVPALAALLALLALSLARTEVAAQMVKPEDFAIAPWSWVSPDRFQLEGVRDCGFNVAGFCTPEALDLVQELGMKCFVYDPTTSVGDAEAGLDDAEIARRVEALVAKVGEHPAAFGYYLRDEPSARVFPGLGRWTAAFARAQPAALTYINLYPNYASPDQMGVPTYQDYLDRYVADVKPRFISYDHYALMDDGSLRGGYFQNLEAVRKVALRGKIPFWNIVLGNSHFHYAEPSPGGLRFQLYTTLAYGGRGISYFTYITPDVGNYRLAPIDQFGNRTPTWDMMRQVNLQAQRLAPTCVKLTSIGVFHHGEVPDGCAGDAAAQVLSRVEGGSFCVGEFSGPDGSSAVMLVNKDLHRSTGFTVEFKEQGHVMMCSPYSGGLQPFGGENGWLAPGQGVLLVLQK